MKKLLLVLFTFSIIFGFACRVGFCAYSPVEGDIKVEDLPGNDFDSVGHCIKGAWCMKLRGNWSSFDIQNPYDNISYLYVIKRPYESGNYSATYYIYGKRNNSNIPVTYKAVNISNSSLSSDSDFAQVIDTAMENATVRTINDDYNSSNDVWADGGWFITNIPMFLYGDDVNLQKYINNGDISGAINRTDVIPPLDVPSPTNLHISNSSKTDSSSKFTAPVVVSWDSGFNENFTWGEMRFKVQYNITYGYKLAGLEYSDNTGLVTIADNVKYKDYTTSYTISADTLNTKITLAFGDMVPASKWIKNIVVYITNIQGDDLTNTSQSRYIQYDYITKTTDSDSIYDDEEDSSEEGGQDSENGGDGVGDGSSGGDSSSYNFKGTITNEYPKWNLWAKLNAVFNKDSVIKSHIDSAFNNITDNLSFTGLLSAVMPFLGNDYWDLIKLAMTMGVGVSGIRCVYKFLRG